MSAVTPFIYIAPSAPCEEALTFAGMMLRAVLILVLIWVTMKLVR